MYGHIHAGNMTDEKEVMDWKESPKGYVGRWREKREGETDILSSQEKKIKNGKLLKKFKNLKHKC